jgi:hypothetical protein
MSTTVARGQSVRRRCLRTGSHEALAFTGSLGAEPKAWTLVAAL